MDRKTAVRAYKETPRPMGVYRVRNTVNGAALIGSSVDVPAILNRHRFGLEYGNHRDRARQADSPSRDSREDRPVKHEPWWKGTRGEWYVVAQAFLFALVLFGPRSLPGWAAWAPPFSWVATGAGAALAIAGGALAVAGLFGLGQANLTALPYPKDEARLAETGPYAIVRHPIYSGLVIGVLGLGLSVNGWLTIGYALVLFAFFDLKSRREERWLIERFPQYAEYRKRVRKLIPWVY